MSIGAKHPTRRWWLILTGALCLVVLPVQAQDPTYVPTEGLAEVKAACRRLEQEGERLQEDIRSQLEAEGKAILALEQTYFDGKAPIQAELRSLNSRIAAYNAKEVRTQAEADRLDAEADSLNARVEAENARLVARYSAFSSAVKTALETETDPEQARKLVSAIEKAGELFRGNKCNFYAGKVGKLMDVPYFRDVLSDKSPDGRMANEIYSFVEKAVKSGASGWKRVSTIEAQMLANSGKFVVGVARNKTPSPEKHGHVCVVSPSAEGQLPHAKHTGSGPWVRDSQNPDLSVKASKRFGSSVVEPIWAVWLGRGNRPK